MKLFAVILVVAIASSAYGKVFERCELARLMYRNGFPMSQIADWVCTAYHESRFDTRAINRYNNDGSKDYGIFQINSEYWCSESSTPGKGCHIRCQSLLNDDIRDDLGCIKIIFGVHGFDAWVAWRQHCSGGRSPSVANCFRDL